MVFCGKGAFSGRIGKAAKQKVAKSGKKKDTETKRLHKKRESQKKCGPTKN